MASHPALNVNCHAVEGHANSELRASQMRNGWCCPLFTMDMQRADIDRDTFVRFFDALEPAFSHQVSIGQSNTIILCPALTSHSELDTDTQEKGGIYLTTMRVAMGTDNVKALIGHLINSARLHIDPVFPGFSEQFMSPDQVDYLYQDVATRVMKQQLASLGNMQQWID